MVGGLDIRPRGVLTVFASRTWLPTQRTLLVNIFDVVNAAQGGQAVGELAKSFGLAPKDAQAVLKSVLPELTSAVARNTLNRGGIADLIDALGKTDFQKSVTTAGSLDGASVEAAGNAALATILGSKHASRKVADRAARDTGVSSDVIRKMLPAIAAMTMGGVARKSSGAFGDIIGQLGALAGSPLPLPGEPPIGRTDRGGTTDDWTSGPRSSVPEIQPRAGGDVGRQSPLPIPGDNIPDIPSRDSPYGDLPDIIRRGGVRLPRGGGNSGGGSGTPSPTTEGGSLDTVIRDLLGGLFGFKNTGFLGWFIQYVVLRYGWRIVQAVLRALIGRR